MCSKSRDSELVIGLVAPVGVDLDPVQNYISEYMKIIGYDENIIRLSRIIKEFPGIKTPIIEDNEYNRIDSLMSAGTEMREKAEIGEILSVLAALDIFESRGENNEPLGKIVHLIRSLKHPAEVMVFRKVYSHGFFLLGVSSSHSNRLNNLENDKDMTNEQAKSLMERDEDETKLLGQRTRDVFHLADGFIDIDKIEEVKEQIYRILDLIFGDPHMTPDPDEYAMNLAFSSALRSADLSRQVGAVIMSSNKEIISLGCNDVPASGGGLYWSNDNKPH